MALETPVLLIIFNRPETTQKVFEAIRMVQPRQLFIAADGPRDNRKSDLELCAKARKIVENIDWDCQVQTLFREKNLGCGLAPSQAITWFFEHVEKGIILEDDCLPGIDFFRFCDTLLDHYSTDERIMMISGRNNLGKWKSDLQSYHFSYLGGIWGWATWRRAWVHFDYEIKLWANSEIRERFKDVIQDDVFFTHRTKIYDQTLIGKDVSWWDYQWGFARIIQSGLSIVPSVNLITNIGFGDDATHTNNADSELANLQSFILPAPIKINEFTAVDREFDKAFMMKLGIVENTNILNKLYKKLININ